MEPSSRSTRSPRTLVTSSIAPAERRAGARVARCLGTLALNSTWGLRTLQHRDGHLQPDELPQRQHLAARHEPRDGRPAAIRPPRSRARLRRGAAHAGQHRSRPAPGRAGLRLRADAGRSAPVSYPVSCSPQAWAAGSGLLALRTWLGLDADPERRELIVAPHLPKDGTR